MSVTVRPISSKVVSAVGAAIMACASFGTEAKSRASIDIPSQSLADSLRALGDQSSTNILFDNALVGDRKVAALRERLTAEEALERLLKDTGIRYEFLNEHTVVLVPPGLSGQETAANGADPAPDGRILQNSAGAAAGAGPVVAAASAGSAPAGNASATSGVEPEQDLASPDMAEVVVTAQRREERLKDVPISISVLGGADLDQSTGQGVASELTRVPGVVAFPNIQLGGGTIISMRGVSAGGAAFAGSNPVSYYLDSVPFSLVQSAVTPDSNAYDMERVEVLRGPQGTLYGASAQAGVVRVLTKDADLRNFDLKARAATSATSGGGGNYRGDMAINVPLIEGVVAARAVLGYQSLSGWVDTPLGRNANSTEMSTARLKVNAQLSERLSMGVSAWISRSDSSGVPASDDNMWRGNLFEETGYNDYNVFGVKVGYDAPAFSISSSTSYLGFKSANDLDTYQQFGVHRIGTLALRGWTIAEELNISSAQEGPWRWTAGAMFRDSTDQNGARRPGTVNYTNTSRSYALFGELTRFFFEEKLGLMIGGRYFSDEVSSVEDPINPPVLPPDYYRDKGRFDSTTPRVVLTWKPNDSVSVYGSYAQGFRSGTPQAYYSTGGRPGGAHVKPDILSNYELGVKGSGAGFSYEAAVYYVNWKNVQQQLTVIFEPTQQYIAMIANGPKASGIGAELGLTMRPVAGLELGANVSWNDLTLGDDIYQGSVLLFQRGERQNNSPELTASLSADYAFPLGASGLRGQASLSGNYASKQGRRSVFNGALTMADGEPMWMTNASFSVIFPRNWEARLYADNLANEYGAVVGSPFFGDDGTTRVRPRTIGLQLDYRF